MAGSDVFAIACHETGNTVAGHSLNPVGGPLRWLRAVGFPTSTKPQMSEEPQETTTLNQAAASAEASTADAPIDCDSFPKALVFGLLAALIGAVCWATVSVLTGYQIGWMAVGVGFLVGFAVRFGGKGWSKGYGFLGGALALLGCLLGNALTIVGYASKELDVGLFQVFNTIDVSLVPSLMAQTFDAMDLLFYGIATFMGYKYSVVS